MTQTGSQDLGWAERWGVVRLVREKLKFVVFFDTQEDAEAAASEAGLHRTSQRDSSSHRFFTGHVRQRRPLSSHRPLRRNPSESAQAS